MGAALLSLDDAEALDPSVVGVKAARLAAGRRFGLPVLPGLVVPCRSGVAAIRAGSEAVAAGRPHAARTAARAVPPDPELVAALAGAESLGDVVVVRSSTTLDADGEWSGAFASLGDVGPLELVTAIRACWASLFAPDVLGRLARTGGSPDDVGVAVLIQPQLLPEAGGWARLTDTRTEVAAVRGGPAALLSGRSGGVHVEIGPDGRIEGSGSPVLDDEEIRLVADTVRAARDGIGASAIEWAIRDHKVVIFQVDASVPSAAAPQPLVMTDLAGATSAAGRVARRLARILLTRRGPLADQLLAGWAAASHATIEVTISGEPAELFELAIEQAAELERFLLADVGLERADFRSSLSAADPIVLGRLDRLHVDPLASARIIAAADVAAAALVQSGRLGHADELWRQTASWVSQALRGGTVPAAIRPFDRFTDVLGYAVASAGRERLGLPASPGRTVGRRTFLASPAQGDRLRHGDVLVVDEPLPAYGQLLWIASGVVSRGGSAAAHLCEVARSLHIPAVVAVQMADDDADPSADDSGSGIPAIAVDGDRGAVWLADL